MSGHGLREVINQHIDTGSDTENSLEMEDEPIDASVSNASQCASSTSEAMEMACSFVRLVVHFLCFILTILTAFRTFRWYYPLLNGSLTCDTEFGSQHFWIDANAHVTLQQGGPGSGETTSAEESGKLASEMLKELVRKHRVTFNPNVSKEGVHGVIDAHGLAIVTACGTLHSGQRCCGTFQQQFGLIRDPETGNNWKIKFTNATLVSKEAVTEAPQLTTSLLALTSSSTASSAASSSPPSRESPSNPMAFS